MQFGIRDGMLGVPFEERFAKAAELGFIDEVIAPRTLRRRLASALGMLADKAESLPRKKHGNIPL